MPLPPNTRLGRYAVRSQLGADDMGGGYLAQETSEPGRTVALKISPAEVAKDRDRLQRFTQEARTVSNLNHPNILTVHEFGQTESASFMARGPCQVGTATRWYSARTWASPASHCVCCASGGK